MSDVLRVSHDGAVARVTLTRPEVHNAFNAELIEALRAAFASLAGEPPAALRVVVLDGEGPSFCAGADITWQRAALALSMADNEADAGRLQAMLLAIDECPAPVVVRVHGAALGGGMGLCAVADVVLAVAGTRFGFTETKLGIMPAVISPFVLAKIGESHARALFPSGERFDAERAKHIGLVHEVLPDVAALDARVDEVVGELLSAGPTAARGAKAVIRDLRAMPRAEALALAVQRGARQRVSAEGQDGLAAFLDKRSPSWKGD
ncbi:MAG TPA: enoyl-CoA hydratase-related protein [Candidatus Dormibacteraeota bacterium]|nr:enoyl-CoA hydratase-related protein [Candidatus Dormibacteraeota bacterium]